MIMDQQDLKLAADFPAVSYDQWKKVVEDKELKGVPFEKKMVTKTPEGIDIHPLYTAEAWPWAQDPSGFPGFFPYTRGTDAIVRTRNGWDIRQEFRETNPKVANREIRHDLGRGVRSVAIRFDDAVRAGRGPAEAETGENGLLAHDLAGLEATLEGVDLKTVPVALEAGAAFLPAAVALSNLWRKQGVSPEDAKGGFGADPVAILAEIGALPVSAATAFKQLGALAAWTVKSWPKVRSVAVDTSVYHNGGANEAHDLGIALATAVAYVKAMEEAGLSIDDACGQIAFTVSVGCEEYMQIAKLRAARKLWAAVAKACGASDAAACMNLRAKSAERMFTHIDPWVNMLRATVSTFASAVGGADVVTCLPFDAAIGLPDDMGRRVARNTQIVLMEESNLYRVADPAGGAWSMETLTTEMTEKAWAFFQEIEAKGGIVAALEQGFVQDAIAATMAERDKAVAKRKIALTGVNEFPNILEKPVTRTVLDLAPVKAEAVAQVGKAAAVKVTGNPVADAAHAIGAGASFAAVVGSETGAAAVKAVPKRHIADTFERLRDAASAFKEKTGAFPSIFLANLGPIAKHTGRATFAKNYFEAGGIMAPGNNGFSDVETCVKAFQESGAKIAVICSSDGLYEEMVPTYAPALKAAGAETVYLAGAPGDKKEAYDAAGVDDYIFMGADVLGKLTAQLVRLGVIAQ